MQTVRQTKFSVVSGHRGPKFRRYFNLSLVFHGAILICFLLQPFLFDSTPKNILPSVQVDLVALPDYVKGKEPKQIDLSKPVKENFKPAEPKAPEPKPKADDMVLKNKKPDPQKSAADILKKLKAEVKKSKKPKSETQSRADRKRVADERKRLKDFENKFRQALKGNQKATGNSATGQIADKATVDAYGMHMVESLRENWGLPANLQASTFRASVLLFIDSNGRIVNYRFTRNSGNTLFDEYVRSAIEQTRFNPPPLKAAKELRNRGVGVNFPL